MIHFLYLSIHTFFIRNHFIRSLCVECQNMQRTYTTKGKVPKELFNLKNCHNNKQVRNRMTVKLINSQNQHRLFARLVLVFNVSLHLS